MAVAPASRLSVVPLTLALANAFVAVHHRHHGRVVGHRFSLGVVDEAGMLRGVAIVGRPVARLLDDGRCCEVTRLCTDCTPNAASALYGAARRVAREMGFARIITYVLAEEVGTSLRAAGWRRVGEAGGGSWDTPSRRRVDRHPTGPKVRWEVVFGGAWCAEAAGDPRAGGARRSANAPADVTGAMGEARGIATSR